jgi:hypothetical protein
MRFTCKACSVIFQHNSVLPGNDFYTRAVAELKPWMEAEGYLMKKKYSCIVKQKSTKNICA